MKKVLIGCGVVILLFVLVAIVLVWNLVRMGKQFAGQMQAVQEKVTTLNRDFPFKPGDNQLMEAPRLDAWLNVEQALRQQADVFEQMADKWDKDMEKKASFSKAFAMAKEQIANVATGVNATVDALRVEQMSVTEYLWIEGQVFGALRSEAIGQQEGLNDLVAAFKKFDEVYGGELNGDLERIGGKTPSDDQVRNMIELIGAKKEAFQAEVESLDKTIMQRGMLNAFLIGGFSVEDAMEPEQREPEPAVGQTPAAAAAQ